MLQVGFSPHSYDNWNKYCTTKTPNKRIHGRLSSKIFLELLLSLVKQAEEVSKRPVYHSLQ